MSKKKTVLVVVAHADDLEFMAAGTVARFASEFDYPVYQYILTDNSRGSLRLGAEELIEISAEEAHAAGRILGLREVRLEGYSDGFLSDVPFNEIRGKIMEVIREVGADIIMSWDPFAPYEEHPDHRVTAMAAYEAAAFARYPLFHPEQPFAPYPVTEAFWFAKHPRNAACYVDIAATLDTKIKALLTHECQMDLTVDMLVQEAHTLEIAIPGLDQALTQGHDALIEDAIRKHAARVAEPSPYAVAERFRYQNLSALDRFLDLSTVKPDFPLADSTPS
ncbi:MAG: PIG-L family deacetylase [Candidatus Hydrogenedentes bacterium]|nr:PIG-L family deacetylase [Candidatus Hydrogenedentota bacterium]